MKQVTFIGNGNMALSIAQGLKDNYKIEVISRDMNRLNAFEDSLGVSIEKSLYENATMEGKTLLLCVKPHNIKEVGALLQGKAKLLISVLAGTTIASLHEHIDASLVVRAMPNLAASVAKSMTTLTGDTQAKEEAKSLLNTIGTTLWLESEDKLDVATALAGSGPAYLALFAEGLTQGAINQGLSKEEATLLMRGLFNGFGDVIQTQEALPLAKAVMSPGGTTEAGCSVLEKHNLNEVCAEVISTAYARAKELSK